MHELSCLEPVGALSCPLLHLFNVIPFVFFHGFLALWQSTMPVLRCTFPAADLESGIPTGVLVPLRTE